MLMIAVGLNVLTALGLLALAAKYLLGPAPADYHSEILVAAGTEVSIALKGVFRAINVVIGSGFLGLALVIVLLTGFGVYNDILWAKVSVLITGLVAGVPATLAAQQLEKHTKIKTPWRPGAGLAVIVVVAFILSVL